jgi:peroxisomal 2,4-dienoyl-CoA reductase
MAATSSSTQAPFAKDILAGRVALVTGGGTGIGFGIVQAFGQHGAKLVIMGRRANKLEEATEKLKAEGIQTLAVAGDVRQPDAVAKAVEQTLKHFGRLDILVNSAAGNFLCPAKDLTPNGFRTVIDIDLDGTFYACRAAFEALKQSGHGVIINISATLHYGATPWQLHASAAKAGIDALTRNLSVEWGPVGIRVVGIAPGPIAGTEGFDRLSALDSSDRAKQMIPVGRLGTVQDIGLAAVFLASDTASFISGHTLVVDGAASLWKPTMVTEERLKMITALLKQQSAAQPKKKAAL